MRIVVDSSVFLAVALDEPDRDWLVEVTKGAEVCAPELLPYEIGNALSAMVKRARLTVAEAGDAFRSYSRMTVRLVPCDVAAALELCSGRGLYAYDAYFLMTALRLRSPLLTLDRGMRAVAAELGIKMLEQDQ
ncbi:MAG: type II toxin-antitoxin system VapC family toxin [Wenzhouxiangella sp.]